MIDIIYKRLNTFITQYFIEMDFLHSDEDKTLHDVDIDEMTPDRWSGK